MLFAIQQYTALLINNSQRIPKGQSNTDSPEKLATQGTQDDEKQSKSTTQIT